MKKFMKKLVPFLLVLLILASLVWYCFVYDRTFTRDVLLSQARRFSSTGNQKISSWFYDMAYLHADHDEDVAIELANQYKSEGNYTKAEYTLTNAIANGGTADLYIALCKTYVEQNKLLDAVNMLASIQNGAIRAQLDALRPAAPTAGPEPGFYTEYITVSLDAAGGTVYYSADGEYPSTDDIPYSEPFRLSSGETKILAVAVADNGLVSPLTDVTYTIGGVIEPVTFTDPAIEGAVRSLLGVDEDRVIYSDELWTITAFTVPEGAETFDDLTMLSYVQKLTFPEYKFHTIHFLSSLTQLEELDLTGCRFSPDELSILADLPKLKRLVLADCGLSTLSGLEGADALEILDLSDNAIRNLEPLSAMVTLRSIDLSRNALTNLNALSGLQNLEQLNVAHNSLSSLAPIATCVKLAWLNVGGNSLTSLGGIDNLAALTHLYADHNALTDVSILGSCTSLIELDIANNAVTDIRDLKELTGLEMLDFSHNQVTAIPKWPEGSMLRTIDGSSNALKDISSLKNLMELSHIYMDYNEIGDISALASCYKLVMVNVYGNPVSGMDALTERDIIVNYTPN